MSWNLSQAAWYHVKLIQQCDRAFRTCPIHIAAQSRDDHGRKPRRTILQKLSRAGLANYYRVRFDRRDDWFDAACRCPVALEGEEGFEPSWMFNRLTSYGTRGNVVSMACGVVHQLYLAWVGSLWLLRRLREYIDTLDEREKMYIVTLQTVDQARSLVHRFLDALPAHSSEQGDHFGAVDRNRVRTALKRRYALLHAAYSAFDTLEATVKAHVEQRDAKHFQMLREQEDVFSTVLKWMRPGSLAALRQADKAFCADVRVAKRLPKMNPRQVVGYFPHERLQAHRLPAQARAPLCGLSGAAHATGRSSLEKKRRSGWQSRARRWPGRDQRVYSHMSEMGIQALMMQDSQRRTKWEQARGPDPSLTRRRSGNRSTGASFSRSAQVHHSARVRGDQGADYNANARAGRFSGTKSLATGATFSAPGRMRELRGGARRAAAAGARGVLRARAQFGARRRRLLPSRASRGHVHRRAVLGQPLPVDGASRGLLGALFRA